MSHYSGSCPHCGEDTCIDVDTQQCSECGKYSFDCMTCPKLRDRIKELEAVLRAGCEVLRKGTRDA